SSDQQTANSPTLAAAQYYPVKSPSPWAQAAHSAKWSTHISSSQTNKHFAAPLQKNKPSSAAQQTTTASPSDGYKNYSNVTTTLMHSSDSPTPSSQAQTVYFSTPTSMGNAHPYGNPTQKTTFTASASPINAHTLSEPS